MAAGDVIRNIKRRGPADGEMIAALADYLDEHGRIYSESPDDIVVDFGENVFGVLHPAFDGTADVWSYIDVGEEAALLIDTGLGDGDYRALAERLTGGLPLTVVNTHHHPDHTGSNGQFGEVYVHEYSLAYINPKKDRKCTAHEYKVHGCADGTRFRLGPEHEAELIYTPGHAQGECCFLDRKRKILFSGDEIMTGRVSAPGQRSRKPYGENTCVTAFAVGTARLLEETADIDVCLAGHNIPAVSPGAIKQIHDTCQRIMDDPEGYDFLSENYVPGEVVRIKTMPGLGEFEYKADGI